MFRVPRRLTFVGVVASLVASVLFASPAAATVINCFHTSGKLHIQFFENGSHRIRAFVNGDGNVQITDDGNPEDTRICVAASEITSAEVEGTASRETFLIDQSGPGGTFPGFWHWNVDLMGGADVFQILGTGARDRLYANTLDVGSIFQVASYRTDGAPHIDLFGVSQVVLVGRGGRDVLGSAVGSYGYAGGGSLSPSRIKLLLKGGGGNDKLFGGSKADTLVAGAGNDAMNGRARRDKCKGGPGTDTAKNCEKVTGVP